MNLRLLGALALALPLAACSVVGAIVPGDDTGTDPGDCTITKNQTFTADASYDEALRLHVESCRMDVDACMSLCSLVLTRQNIEASAQTCKARFDGDVATLQIQYSMPNPSSPCQFDGQPVPAGQAGPTR